MSESIAVLMENPMITRGTSTENICESNSNIIFNSTITGNVFTNDSGNITENIVIGNIVIGNVTENIITTKKKEKSLKPRIIEIGVVQRNRRSFLTSISGIELYNDIDMKDVCKILKKKFACGVSQNKKSGNIEIQGDFQCEVGEFIIKTWKQIDSKSVVYLAKKLQTKK